MKRWFERAAKSFLVVTALASLTQCVPEPRKVTPGPQVRASASPSVQPTLTTPPTQGSNSSAAGCPAGSEAAVAELRNCCRERNWGKACDGGCWAAGVGEKLKQMCNASKTPVSDCAQSPDKSKVTEWCAFHYNRRYCGVSDATWISTCKSGAPSGSNSGGNDCGNSPQKSQLRDWCNFHYNRRYCGISDADWVQACTPAGPSAAAAPSPTPTPTTATATCKPTETRGFPFPRCPERKSAKVCEEGVNGNEQGRYCVWTGN